MRDRFRRLVPFVIAASSFAAAGCATTTDATSGGAGADAATVDTGSLDAGASDAATPDTATPDSATSDTDPTPADAALDAGDPDATPEDATPEASTDAPSTDAPDDTCGGVAGATCGSGAYCKTKDGQCFVPDGVGTCEPIPEGCTKELAPVCGCDGNTYDNPCLAAQAGVSLAHTGACPSAGKQCGGKTGATCSPTEYCDYPDDAMCGAFDATGHCQTRPGGCPVHYDPVCGCDGNTYGNDCSARSAGVDVLHKGECPGAD